tara:strand:+ start:309 stop:575 length:267 start_codon:yes stop_codon:yes gene_type:complete
LSSKIKILHQDCDPTLAQDKSLPQTAYLVEYLVDGLTKFDLVISGKKVDIFDQYYDDYRKDLLNITQSSGTANPKTWGDTSPSSKKKK